MKYLKYAKLAVPYLAQLPKVGAIAPTLWFLAVALNETIKESAVQDEFAWRDGLLKAADQLILMIQWAAG